MRNCHKYIIALLFLIPYTSFVNAQTIKFNKTYTDTMPSIRNIVEIDSGYAMLGGGYTNNKLEIIVPIIDFYGNLIETKRFGDSQYSYYHGTENSLINNSEGFSLAGNISDGTNVGCLLMKFDDQLDTLWSKTYLLDSVPTYFYGGNVTQENDYISTGVTRKDENNQVLNNSDVLLFKTDSAGNLQWFKNYGGGDADYGHYVLETPDEGFLIGGWTRSFNNHVAQGYRGDWYLVKTDSLGNMQWDEHYGNPNYDDGRMGDLVMDTSQTAYYMCGSYQVIDDGSSCTQYARIIKLDEFFNISWDKYYYRESNKNASFIGMKPLGDGNYLLLHEEVFNNAYLRSSFVKVNKKGEVLWKREFNIPGSGSSTQYLLDVIETPDGGFAASGWAYGGSLNPYQQAWAVKTDSLGCDNAGSCTDTSLTIILVTDTICYSNSALVTFHITGKSAPYQIELSNGNSKDSIFYSPVFKNYAYDSLYIYPLDSMMQHSFSATVTDPWGNSVTENFSVYVDGCWNSRDDLVRKQDNIKIYPNPTTGKAIIEARGIERVEIIDAQGKNIFTSIEKCNELEIDMECFSKGVYFVKVITLKGAIIEKVILE